MKKAQALAPQLDHDIARAIGQSQKALVETEASKRAVEKRLKVKASETVAQVNLDNEFEAPAGAVVAAAPAAKRADAALDRGDLGETHRRR